MSAWYATDSLRFLSRSALEKNLPGEADAPMLEFPPAAPPPKPLRAGENAWLMISSTDFGLYVLDFPFARIEPAPVAENVVALSGDAVPPAVILKSSFESKVEEAKFLVELKEEERRRFLSEELLFT